MTPSPLDDAKGDLAASVWPPSFSTASAPVAAVVFGLERSQWLSADTISERQALQLAVLLDHFAKHSPVFADCGGKPLASLPILTRRDVQARYSEQHVTDLPDGFGPAYPVSTSGSTGEPVKLWRSQVNMLHWVAQTMRWHLWSEPDFTGRLAASHATVPGGIVFEPQWGAPVPLFGDTGPFLRIDLATDIGAQIDALATFKPTSLIAYPSTLREMLLRGATFAGLKRVRALGESLSDDLRGALTARWNVTVSDCYSSAEVGYIGLQCPDSDLYHVMAESVIVEILTEDGTPCHDGESGRITITDLHNFATPMIRYQTGDYGVAGPASCPCGRGLPTLRKILGRTRNMITKPDGSRHWPLTGFARFREIAPITQYQMIQHAPDAIEMRIVAERGLTLPEEHALKDHLRKVLGDGITVMLAYHEGRLPIGPTGKFEEFMSLIGESA